MIRVYLEAGTASQNAERARELLATFISNDMESRRSAVVNVVYYIENASGTKLDGLN